MTCLQRRHIHGTRVYEKYSVSFITRKMSIKTTVQYYITLIGQPFLEKQNKANNRQNNKCWSGCEKLGPLGDGWSVSCPKTSDSTAGLCLRELKTHPTEIRPERSRGRVQTDRACCAPEALSWSACSAHPLCKVTDSSRNLTSTASQLLWGWSPGLGPATRDQLVL